jgi:hypothetical protein
LGSFGVIFAEVTDVDDFGFGVNHDGAVIAGFNAPATAIAFVGVYGDYAGGFVLFHGISWARGDAGWFFAKATCDGYVDDLVLTDSADSAFHGVKHFCLGVAACVFAGLAAHAAVWVAADEFAFMNRNHPLSLLFGFH